MMSLLISISQSFLIMKQEKIKLSVLHFKKACKKVNEKDLQLKSLLLAVCLQCEDAFI